MEILLWVDLRWVGSCCGAPSVVAWCAFLCYNQYITKEKRRKQNADKSL